MDSKILNLFSFLNSNENRYTDSILNSLSTLDDFKQFKNLPKETLDILICKHGFNPDNKEIVDYLKSLGGSDDFFKDVKKWMEEIFKDLQIFKCEYYKDITLYGKSSDNILLVYDNFYLLSKFRFSIYYEFIEVFNNYITEEFGYKTIISIFHEYLNNNLDLKANETGYFSGSYIPLLGKISK